MEKSEIKNQKALIEIELAKLLVGEWAEEMRVPFPNWLDVYLQKPEDLVPAAVGLRVKRLGYLSAITGLDHQRENGELEVIYHFCPQDLVINLRIRFSYESAKIPSLGEVIPGAIPFERELQEMFGVEVLGLHEKDHLYLPDDWPVETYPLRKDFDPAVLKTDQEE